MPSKEKKSRTSSLPKSQPKNKKKVVTKKKVEKKQYKRKNDVNSVFPNSNSFAEPTKKSSSGSDKNINIHRRQPEVIVRNDSVCVNYSRPSATSFNVSRVSVFTDDNHLHLINVLSRYGVGRIVVGCVAWLTSPLIIKSLSKSKAVSLLVNRENYKKWGNGCVNPEKYRPLPGFKVLFSDIWGGRIETPLNQLKVVYKDPVRCYGDPSESSEKKEGRHVFAHSLMHAKYLVICDDSDMPRYLWCGSMNFTANSNNNQELNVLLDDPTLAMHVFMDFGISFLKSETLTF
jgi:hypothetical protein